MHLALRAPTQAAFLAVDPPLIRPLEIASARPADGPVRARVLARLARELLADVSARTRRRALADEALALVRAAGNRRCWPRCWMRGCRRCGIPAAAADRLAVASEIIDLAWAGGEDAQERRGMFWRFVALMELGRVAEAESVLAAFERTAQQAGDGEAMVSARHAMLATVRGRFGETLSLADQVLDSGGRIAAWHRLDLRHAARDGPCRAGNR